MFTKTGIHVNVTRTSLFNNIFTLWTISDWLMKSKKYKPIAAPERIPSGFKVAEFKVSWRKHFSLMLSPFNPKSFLDYFRRKWSWTGPEIVLKSLSRRWFLLPKNSFVLSKLWKLSINMLVLAFDKFSPKWFLSETIECLDHFNQNFQSKIDDRWCEQALFLWDANEHLCIQLQENRNLWAFDHKATWTAT